MNVRNLAEGAGRRLPSASPTKPPRISRRLPVQKTWAIWTLVAVQLSLFLGLLVLWELAAEMRWLNAFFWSRPSQILATAYTFFKAGTAWTDIAYTFRATLMGFAVGTAIGAALGLSFWWSRNFALVMQPLIICIESMPKLALAPLIILVFGIGIASKIALASALTLVVSTLTTYSGVQSVDRDQERLFYSLGAGRWPVFTKLVVPTCVPFLISTLRVNIGLALTGAIIGEFVGSQYGLGRTILYAGSTYDIALVWVAISVLSALSIVMYVTVSWLENFLRKGIAH